MLRSVCWGLSMLALVAAVDRISAQEPETDHAAVPSIRTDFSPGMLPPTPEMWFYDQEMRRLHQPSEMVYAKARHRAAQRQKRIAAMEWYGYSNSRPVASNNNMIGSYSPRWVSNTWDTYSFRPTNSGFLVLRAGAKLY